MLLAVAIGAVGISPGAILGMIAHKLAPASFAITWRPSEEAIIFDVRLVRVAGAALVGGCLGVAGVLFQGLLRNPMADPYIIGTSAGAALGATLALLLPVGASFLSFGVVPLAAFWGAVGAVLLVYNLARVGGRTPVISMLLAGFAVSSLLAAIMSLLLAVSGGLHLKLPAVFNFLLGGVSVSKWGQLAVILPLAIMGIVLASYFAFHLNAFSLGEEGAAYLGINIEREKLFILAVGSLLTAVAVSLSGLVGFVGLVVPHALRLVLGPDHRLLVPTAALAGGAFLVLADLLARTVLSPTELPVGVLTALLGGPFFIYLLRRTRREYAF
ncbi:MAG: iron chelate uptake ABC transporter family permease subunit [Chloroflexi bacterium]|nr:iron chelate uptake ABC transporter family permease subunit [Chloroflexota bacterium]